MFVKKSSQNQSAGCWLSSAVTDYIITSNSVMPVSDVHYAVYRVSIHFTQTSVLHLNLMTNHADFNIALTDKLVAYLDVNSLLSYANKALYIISVRNNYWETNTHVTSIEIHFRVTQLIIIWTTTTTLFQSNMFFVVN